MAQDQTRIVVWLEHYTTTFYITFGLGEYESVSLYICHIPLPRGISNIITKYKMVAPKLITKRTEPQTSGCDNTLDRGKFYRTLFFTISLCSYINPNKVFWGL